MRFKMKQKIHASLCGSCEHAQIMTHQNNRLQILCTNPYPARLVRHDITDCTEYFERNKMTRHDYEKVAWVIETSQDRKTVGFIKPGTDRHREIFEGKNNPS